MGWIAADIDGTLTAEAHTLPEEVKGALATWHSKGWRLLFVTGRPFAFGQKVVGALPFAYHIAVQNGSTLLKMPGKDVIYCNYLSTKELPRLDAIFAQSGLDYLVEAGVQADDVCYYRPQSYGKTDLEYLRFREELASAPFLPVADFEHLPFASFPLIKAFGPLQALQQIAEQVRAQIGLAVTVVHDPFRKGQHIALMTRSDVNKGNAVAFLLEQQAVRGPLITAGDDSNDLSFIPMGDQRIVMEGAPSDLLKHATIVARPAKEGGIVAALAEAIQRLSP
jgi:hydroxymethylpyrimidine pyrophosphatase-like HAD family hydrolase